MTGGLRRSNTRRQGRQVTRADVMTERLGRKILAEAWQETGSGVATTTGHRFPACQLFLAAANGSVIGALAHLPRPGHVRAPA